jgi:TonB family protein
MNARRFPLRIFAASALCFAAVASAKNTPVRIEQTAEPQFPASLTFTPITSGEARVMINVDAEGKLADLMVTSYTNSAFADEAVNLLKRWRYSPATVDGEPVGVRMELLVRFESRGRVISLTSIETTEAFTLRIMPPEITRRVCGSRELDRPLEVLHAEAPLHPGRAQNAEQASGSTLVDFYVDENGIARMPVVLETTNASYAQAAVGAIEQWRFSTPTKAGKPVAVRVQQRFVFQSES